MTDVCGEGDLSRREPDTQALETRTAGPAQVEVASEDRRVIGIVVAHGRLAHGLVSAVKRIAGGGAEILRPLSNEGLSPEELCDRIEEMAAGHPTLVFSDLGTGSCGFAAHACCRDNRARVAVGGVNLPMLLTFVYAERDRPGEIARKMVECGRDAISFGAGD
ncbi:MAG: hypothetical protein J4G12_08255 [Gemmatimonadetes bacterium]|nr:hypothetical protein [Gemmatimonadota bacterium]